MKNSPSSDNKISSGSAAGPGRAQKSAPAPGDASSVGLLCWLRINESWVPRGQRRRRRRLLSLFNVPAPWSVKFDNSRLPPTAYRRSRSCSRCRSSSASSRSSPIAITSSRRGPKMSSSAVRRLAGREYRFGRALTPAKGGGGNATPNYAPAGSQLTPQNILGQFF